MTAMMGSGQSGSSDDMFAKLDSMKEIISEVNTQFKDPVRSLTTLPTLHQHSSKL